MSSPHFLPDSFLSAFTLTSKSLTIITIVPFMCSSFFLSASMRTQSSQSCLPLCDPMDCSLPDFSVHGIPQARILEWVAVSSSRGSFPQPRDQTHISCVSCIAGGFFTHWATWEVYFILTRSCSAWTERINKTGPMKFLPLPCHLLSYAVCYLTIDFMIFRSPVLDYKFSKKKNDLYLSSGDGRTKSHAYFICCVIFGKGLLCDKCKFMLRPISWSQRVIMQ